LEKVYDVTEKTHTHTPTCSAHGYAQYLRRELPPLVRRELEDAFEHEFELVEAGMKKRAADLVKNLSLKLFRTYQGIPPPPAKLDAPERKDEGPIDSSGHYDPLATFKIGRTPDSLENENIFHGLLDYIDGEFNNVSASTSWQIEPAHPDSAYGSYTTIIE
jgi:hypothetical protein